MDTIERIYKVFKDGASICTDTRKVVDNAIFFALKGDNFNGNLFAAKALENGASLAIVDELVGLNDDRVIRVQNVLECLQQLARHHRQQLPIPFLAITGSNGKTTTKELISRVLSIKMKTLYTSGNLNNHIGVPLTLLSVNSSHEIAVIEMGANHQKEIELLCSIALPTHVLITNVGKAHLEGFGGFEGVKKGKGEMYEFAKKHKALVFINNNNTHLLDMLGTYDRVFTYGTGNNCDINGEMNDNGMYVSVSWNSKNNTGNHLLKTHIPGDYNFENILSAIAVGTYFNIPANSINHAIGNYIPDNQRSQEIIKGDLHIIMDAYNANPTSMEAALKNFADKFTEKRAVFLGDMFELGSDSLNEHKKILELIEGYHFEKVVLVGPQFKNAGTGMDAVYCDNSDEAAQLIKSMNLHGFNLLIKGSRGSKMEKVLDALG